MQALDAIAEEIDRAEKIQDVYHKSIELQDVSQSFASSAQSVNNKFWWQNVKCWIGIICVVLLLILILVLAICNPNFSKCK